MINGNFFTEKTKTIVFRTGGNISSNEYFSFNDKVIEIVNEVKYLRTVFTSGGSNGNSQKQLVAQARKATFSLLKRTNQFHSMPVDVMLSLYDKYMEPILNYGSGVSGIRSHCVTDINKIFICRL